MRRRCWLGCLAGLSCLLALQADELVLGDQTVKGVFTGYDKGRFQFQTWDGKSRRDKAMDVRKLILDKPLNVVLETRSRQDAETVLFKGYASGQFRLVRAGRDVVERESQVRRLVLHESEQSFAGYMERAQEAEGDEAAAAEPAPQRLEDLLELGKLTVIHFHQPDSVTSTRQGSYCRRLADDSHGRLVYRKITIASPSAAAAGTFGVTTLPQFWFYTRTGKLATKLTERFTAADFEGAIEATRKGGLAAGGD